ncbi:MAG: formylglycine-generating enzyme family protein [bacterium]|nr:formylglycine-generating enzyme family protein [bacterium]
MPSHWFKRLLETWSKVKMDFFGRSQIVLLISGLFVNSGLIHSQSVTPELSTPAKKSLNCGCNTLPSRFGQPNTMQTVHQGMVKIPEGSFLMGGDTHQAKRDEFPKHEVHISSFWFDEAAVTNEQFQQFVSATGYVTTAEKKPDWEELKTQLPANTTKPDESKLVAASLVFTPPNYRVPLDDYSQWWSWMPGADWKHPRGPKSVITNLGKHPVVHMSWFDATAYCQWKGKRLPTEAEWEWGARGGLINKPYPWGDEPIDDGAVKANTWQGQFPYQNSLRDTYYYTSPTKTFPPNKYGLYDMAGNVWEWVFDWYDYNYYQSVSKGISQNPQGPSTSLDPNEPYAKKRVLRGGSFLCNENYCTGYRVSARMKSTPDTSMEHMGFRCARST